MSCPQCQHTEFAIGSFKMGTGLRHGYAPLLDREGEPRQSVEEAEANEGDGLV